MFQEGVLSREAGILRGGVPMRLENFLRLAINRADDAGQDAIVSTPLTRTMIPECFHILQYV